MWETIFKGVQWHRRGKLLRASAGSKSCPAARLIKRFRLLSPLSQLHQAFREITGVEQTRTR